MAIFPRLVATLNVLAHMFEIRVGHYGGHDGVTVASSNRQHMNCTEVYEHVFLCVMY